MTEQEVISLAKEASEMSATMASLSLRPWILEKKHVQQIEPAEKLLNDIKSKLEEGIPDGPSKRQLEFQMNMLESFVDSAKRSISEFRKGIKEAGWKLQ